MSSADTPLPSAAAPAAAQDHCHETPTVPPALAPRPLTLLTSGLRHRLGAAALLTALLWAVVLWALA